MDAPPYFSIFFFVTPNLYRNIFVLGFTVSRTAQWCEMYDFSPVKYTVISLKSKALNTIDFGTPKCLPKNRNVGRK